jgi:hypothetical protein
MQQGTEFVTDNNGDAVIFPVADWKTGVAEAHGILIFRYVESLEAIEKGDCQQAQFLLTVQQCVELAAALTRLSTLLQSAPNPEHSN